MEEFLIERDTLARIADMLISQKYPNQPPADLNEIREDCIRKLDDKIGAKVFGSLDEEQLEEFNHILDDQKQDTTVFQNFFKNAGVNLEQKIAEAVQEFSGDFVGGKNE